MENRVQDVVLCTDKVGGKHRSPRSVPCRSTWLLGVGFLGAGLVGIFLPWTGQAEIRPSVGSASSHRGAEGPLEGALSGPVASAEVESAGVPESGGRIYRISGVAVNGRDGTPIARARIVVTEVERGIRVGNGGRGSGESGDRSGADEVGGRGAGRGQTANPMRRGQEANGSQNPEPVMTDASGRFSVVVAHQGTYRVAGSARNFQLQAYEAHGTFFAGVVLTPSAPEQTLTLKLTGDATISGFVFDEAGDGVRNAQVRAELLRPVEANMGQAQAMRTAQYGQTDDRGHYELSPLSPGKYVVRVTAQPWYANVAAGRRTFSANGSTPTAPLPPPDPSLDLVYAETWYPSATDAGGAETVVLSGSEERQADFHLSPIPSIHLRVPRPEEAASGATEGRRGPGAPMVIRTDGSGFGGGFGGGMTITTSGQEWDIGGLTPGTYQVRMADQVAGGSSQMTQVRLGAGQTVVGMTAATTETVPVEVTVEGVPERQVRQITLVDVASRQSYTDGGGRRGRVPERDNEDEDEDGKPKTVRVPPGTYEVYLGGAQGLFLTGVTAAAAEVKGRTVTVAGAMKLTVHAATGLGQVEGIARRDTKAMAGGLVLLVPAGYGRADNLAPVREDETNTDGSFTLRGVIPGGYILVAIDQGWEVNWRDSGTLLGYLGQGVAVEVKGDGVVRKEVEGVAP